MDEIYPDLWLLQSDTGSKTAGFAYLLKRDAGNVLMGRSDDITSQLPFLADHGGVQQIYIHDRHMGKAGMGRNTEMLGLGVICSAVEAPACHKTVAIAERLPMETAQVLPDLKIVPTPGHTRGAFSHIWENGDHRYLFIGDTLCPVDGEWQFWVSKKNTDLMIQSMEALKEEEFDVILSNSFICKPFAWTTVLRGEKETILSDVITALRAR